MKVLTIVLIMLCAFAGGGLFTLAAALNWSAYSKQTRHKAYAVYGAYVIFGIICICMAVRWPI